MAKFKLGDKVTDGNAVYEITGIDNGFGSYEWKLISGRADPSHSDGGDFGWADAKMKIANSCACNSTNPVVANAMNACGTARNAKFATDQYEFDMLHEAADKLEEVAKSIYYQGDKSTYAKYKDEIKRLADRAFRISQHG